MTDEQLVENLKALASRTPEIPVDRERVLAVGRRRRAQRAMGVAGGVGVLCTGLVVGALAWGGPAIDAGPEPLPASSDEPTVLDPEPAEEQGVSWDTYPPSPDDGEHAVVDYEAGTIWLPEDDWGATAEEQAVIDTAQVYLEIQCLTDLGYGDEVEFAGPVAPYDERQRGLGLWTAADLDRDYGDLVDRGAFWFGFEPVGPQNDISIPGDNAPVADDPDAGENWTGCVEGAEDRLRDMTQADWAATAWSQGTGGRPDHAADYGTSYRTEGAIGDLEDSWEREAARGAVEIVREWEECIASEGLGVMDAQALVPEGVVNFEGAYTAEQRAIMQDIAEQDAVAMEESDGIVGEPDYGYTDEELAFIDAPRPRPLLVGTAAEQRRVVEVDVRCKQELGIVQRLADLDAEIQLQYIADNPEYFESRKEITDTMLTNARDVLDEAGVTMP